MQMLGLGGTWNGDDIALVVDGEKKGRPVFDFDKFVQELEQQDDGLRAAADAGVSYF